MSAARCPECKGERGWYGPCPTCGADPPAAIAPRYKTITFKQRSLLRPWRVEWITQAWSDYLRCWVVVSRVKA